MSKVYKSNSRLVVNIPFEVIKTLGLGEGEEVDFFNYQGKYFIFAKKSDIVALMLGIERSEQQQQQPQAGYALGPRAIQLDDEELRLLKKLDTVRYGERTKSKISLMMDKQEKAVMKRLIAKKVVAPYAKSAGQEPKYGISKSVYDAFLFGKREKGGQGAAQGQSQPTARQEQRPQGKEWSAPKSISSYVQTLESNGFLVLGTEPEAAQLSLELEDSIKRGLVVGTRAFNRKFYVLTRSFMNKNAPKVIKALEKKPMNVADLAEATGVEEDGIRTILYLMAEGGEATELKRDYFSLV